MNISKSPKGARTGWKAALLCGVAGLVLPLVAAAQQPGPQQTQQARPTPQGADAERARLEEIVVTGSRIRRPEFTGVIPGTQLGAAEIDRRGFTNAIDVLNDLPLVGVGANLNGTNGGQTASLGAAFVDLLDLGTARTLTLVNGRRFVSGNAATIFVSGNETGSQVDASNIPVALLERVDVLTVGGAVAYGSDAIAGVVNYVLKDNYEGAAVTFRGGQTFKGDAGRKAAQAVLGQNFLNDRANITLSLDYSRIDPLTALERDFRASNPTSVTNWANGARRNTSFAPNAAINVAGLNNGAFLRATDDGVSGTTYLPLGARSATISPGGVIFNVTGTVAGAVNQIGPVANTNVAGATQLVPGTPLGAIGGGTAGNPFGATGNPLATFAPSALPTGVTAAQVFTAFNVTPPTGLTQAQLTTLAINVLQANRPTPREYWAANPNIPLNALLGTLIPALPDVANPDPASNRFFPRLAVPIRFNEQGNVEQFSLSSMTPTQPGTLGAHPGGTGTNPVNDTTILRIGQSRQIGTLMGRFDITPEVRYFTENLYSKLSASSPANAGGLFNGVTSGTIENAGLIMNVNNPFLDNQDRAALAAAGITGNFVLSRDNRDILGANRFVADTETLRTVQGLRGDIPLLGRRLDWELSYTFGKAKSEISTAGIRDVEYALAIDAVRDPVTGNIVCRAQTLPTVPASVPGIFGNVVRTPGPDGIPTDRIFTPAPTRAMVDACVPLNVFGVNQMSQAAKDYVTARTTLQNKSTQHFFQGFISGDLVDLPAGGLGYSVVGEYRTEELDYRTDELSRLGRTRSAALPWTNAKTDSMEYGIEGRLPIFGGDFTFPLLQNLEVEGGIRWVKLEGSAPQYRDIRGTLQNPRYEGDTEQIWSARAQYSPIQDIMFRGNYTKSIRQPSIVELFLAGQPFFTSAADPCSTGNITLGPRPATRRANCEQAVIDAGLAADRTAAANFLNSFVPTGAAFQGLISGEPNLKPEDSTGFTMGTVLSPRWVPGLQVSLDYIHIRIDDVVGPLLAQPAAQFCYDSPTFPDTTGQLGINVCPGVVRDGTFNFTNGFVLPFYNLPSTMVRAWNGNFDYRTDVADIFSLFGGDDTANWGTLRLRGMVYHLKEYATSGSGTFDGDTIRSEGTFDRPDWKTQLRVNYGLDKFRTEWTWNWQTSTIIRSGGSPITIENQDVLGYPSFSTHNLMMSYDIYEDVTLQLNIDNVFNTNYAGEEGRINGPGAGTGYVDQIGRRWLVTLRAEF